MPTLNIRTERIKRGWSQSHVGQQAGISKVAVHEIETGQNDPSYKVLCKLEDLFGLPHRQLFAVADGESSLSAK